jgi:hypothetical protein
MSDEGIEFRFKPEGPSRHGSFQCGVLYHIAMRGGGGGGYVFACSTVGLRCEPKRFVEYNHGAGVDARGRGCAQRY